MLLEIDPLLNRLQEQNLPNETINNINIVTINYIKKFSKKSAPRNSIMTRKYLKEHDLLAVPIDKKYGNLSDEMQKIRKQINGYITQFKKIEKSRKNAKDICLKEEERINIF